MKRAATPLLVMLLAAATWMGVSSPASAALRVPQVPVLGGTLQGYLTGVGESINVLTQQEATQSWTNTTSSTIGLTIMVELSPNANVNDVGMYNASDAVPALNVLLFGSANPLAFASCTFLAGNQLRVNRFDENAILIGQQVFNGVDKTNFGFYLQGPGGTSYTQDARNPGGKAQAVSFKGTGANAGTWWVCFEESPVATGSDQDFDDLVVIMESINPTPVSTTTWGALKARFR